LKKEEKFQTAGGMRATFNQNNLKSGGNMRQRGYSIGILVLFCAAALLYGEKAGLVLDPIGVEVQRAHMTTWTNYCTVTVDQLADFQPLEIPLGKYGGRTDRREEATGFFHAKKVDGHWILVDPEGYHFFSAGVNSVNPSDNLPDCRYAFPAKFGSRQKWAEETYDLLQELGFNTLGNWSAGALFKEAGGRCLIRSACRSSATMLKRRGSICPGMEAQT
jgi:hypothetical protein